MGKISLTPTPDFVLSTFHSEKAHMADRKITADFWKDLLRSDRTALHVSIYTWAARMMTSGFVLDLGCEYGLGSLLITDANPELRVLAIDDHYSALCRLFDNDRVAWINANAMSIPCPANCFTGIFLVNLLHLVKDPEIVISEVNRVLQPDGYAVISIPEPTFFGSGEERDQFIKRVEERLEITFSKVSLPKTISGEIPFSPVRTFPIDSKTSPWIALCKKKP